jgi:Holliday junction resolvasome RuvABC endonuclease subunit
MLALPGGDDKLRILAFDPGTDSLGAAILEVDIPTRTGTFIDVQTFIANKTLKYVDSYKEVAEHHTDRFTRLLTHEDNIYQYANYWMPHTVACESPFMFRMPKAFAALTECVYILRMALFKYDPSVGFHMVTPMQGKSVVKAAFKGTTKDDVKKGLVDVLSNPSAHNLYYQAPVLFDSLDEHSVDAMVIGIYHYHQWMAYLDSWR